MLMKDSPRPLALELPHELDALLKICQLTTVISLNSCLNDTSRNDHRNDHSDHHESSGFR